MVWDGLVDDLRLSRVALKPKQLLVTRESAGDDTVGYWCFEEPSFFKDSSPNGHNIPSDMAPTGGADAKTATLIDFCHLLFNANEFLTWISKPHFWKEDLHESSAQFFSMNLL